MNFYEILSETLEVQHGYWEPPEHTCFYGIVFESTRSKAKYRFYKKYRREVGVQKISHFPRVSIRKLNLSNEEDRELVQEYVFRDEVL